MVPWIVSSWYPLVIGAPAPRRPSITGSGNTCLQPLQADLDTSNRALIQAHVVVPGQVKAAAAVLECPLCLDHYLATLRLRPLRGLRSA
jgi:hypothetical protein